MAKVRQTAGGLKPLLKREETAKPIKSVGDLSPEDIFMNADDWQKSVETLKAMASHSLARELVLKGGILDMHGESAYIAFRRCVEFIFGENLYPSIEKGAREEAKEIIAKECRLMNDVFKEESFLLVGDYHDYNRGGE